jgi:methionine salvage enolase-phosphatase E1
MGLEAHEILFISDVVTELEAANEAGMKTVLSIRPGNEPQPQCPSIRSFTEIR